MPSGVQLKKGDRILGLKSYGFTKGRGKNKVNLVKRAKGLKKQQDVKDRKS